MTYIANSKTVTVYINTKVYTADDSHPNFNRILKAIKKGKSDKKIAKLFNTTETVKNYYKGFIKIVDGVLTYKGEQLNNVLTDKILQMLREGFNIDPFIKFIENVKENPSYTAQKELYLYLEAGNLPITDDGMFLSYKSVNVDYKDYHSGTFDNSIGSICEMPRSQVDDDRNITCSHGLHAAQLSYAKGFGSGGHLMVVKINPRDVVSIPKDYNNTKLRCCRYEVISEIARDDDPLEMAVYGDDDYGYYPDAEDYTLDDDYEWDDRDDG